MSCDLETDGFDVSAGKTWIYPENYPVRDYQFNIVEAALYNNTLVCLPTGLGKTFIAAVVMYNFWRWYPRGKVIFLAPTKPLVAQQILACHNTMGIPSAETIELTGAVSKKNREVAWNKKRVIFATPQVFENDLQKAIIPATMVKCVVIDEAHKALGKHSYCECIRLLHMQHQYFRVLALSATPGNKITSVQEVLQNLHISHLELRDEMSSDIVPYINQRKIDIILVPLSDELAKYKERYIIIMDRHVKVLIQNNVLHSQTANISKGRIFHLSREFQKKTNKSGNYSSIMKTLNILMTMYHAYELMVRHGLRAFHKFFENHSDKYWMNNEHSLQILLDDIKQYLGPFPDSQSFTDTTIPKLPATVVFGHNKFYKLKELLTQHFERAAKAQISTRAIVFVEYKDIVYEVYVLLLQTRPLIRPQMFVGISGQKQKQQKQALENFKNDHVNVLISTSIGEEGLDVGEVDLIICFDASQQSPIRLVQRMGRTGRKRDGHIIVLVTDGKEHETLRSAMAKRDFMNTKILNTSNILTSLYENNPRMIPENIKPECYKMHINIQPKTPAEKKRGRKAINEKKKTNILADLQSNNNKLKLPKSDSKTITQTSMTKFLSNSKQKDQLMDTNGPTNIETWCNTAARKVDESNIMLLSSDNETIDFLTICAMKKSEKEMSADECRKIDISYISTRLPIENLFNFSVPNLKILDNISLLTDKVAINLPPNNEMMVEDIDNLSDSDFWCSNVHQPSNPFQKFDKPINVNLGESKFESILDESSDSDTIVASDNGKLATRFEDERSISCENIFEESFELFSNNEWCSSEKQTDNVKECDNYVIHSPKEVAARQKDELSTKPIANAKTVQPAIIDISSDESIFEELVKNINIEESSPKQTSQTSNRTTELHPDNNLKHAMQSGQSKNKDLDTTELEVADFEWDSDFEVSSTVISKAGYFGKENKSTPANVQQNNTNVLSPSSFFDFDDTDSNDWISVDLNKRTDVEKNTSPQIGCKKVGRLSNLRRSTPLRRTSSCRVSSTDSNFCLTSNDVAELDQIESNFFGKQDTSSNEKNDYKSKNSSSNICPNNNFNTQRSAIKSNLVDKKSFDVKDKQATQANNKKKKPKVQRKKNEFLDDEAEVSSDGSSDESSGTDDDLGNFVSYTQDISDGVDMHAHYLQAIRSPAARPGAYLFKRPTLAKPDINVYSQPLSDEDESYLYDSFCVEPGADETNVSKQAFGYSILEEAEKALKNKKRKRSRQEDDKSSNSGKKLKKINVLNTSTSSEDEIEQLRAQICEKWTQRGAPE